VPLLLVLLLLLAPLLLLVAPGAAWAAESIPAYDVQVQVRADGSLHVREAITYDFGTAERHGLTREIPVRYRYDETDDRVVLVDDVRVTSPTGAPTDVERTDDGDLLVLRIGDPDRTVTGRQVYVLDYDVRGAMNPFPDHAEVFWNAVGADWSAAVGTVTATVTGPAAATRAACFAGPDGSALPCTSATISAGRAVFTQTALQPYEGMTVAVAFPVGSVTVPPPILDERFSPARAFEVTPWTVVGALLVLGAGLFGVGWFAWTRGRDRRWRGQVPGLDPAAGQADDVSATEARPMFTSPAGAVEFQPPDGVRPGEIGTLIDERANPLDVTATIVDLAVRGYLRITELPRPHWFASRDWRLDQLKDADDALMAYEKTLLAALFKGRTQVAVSELKRTFAADLGKVQEMLYADVVRLGWFRRRPDRTRRAWAVLGIVCVALGAGLTYLLARYTHLGLLGVAAVLAGLALLVVSRWMPARTARGSAALARTLGFRQYLRTAEAEQLRFEERADVFSRYLPYAVVFGETDRWAKAFASLADDPRTATTMAWYVGPAGWDFGSFGDSMSSFSSTTSSTLSTTASSGGSGFSGGSSGGGFGGGGGGSW
jgi:uncharacterized protein (TIGR04222 family)